MRVDADGHVWASAQELADVRLPGLPESPRGVRALARRQGWPERTRGGKGGGTEWRVTQNPDVPARALAAVFRRRPDLLVGRRAPAPAAEPAPAAAPGAPDATPPSDATAEATAEAKAAAAAAVVARVAARDAERAATHERRREALHQAWRRRTDAQRAAGMRRAAAVRAVAALLAAGTPKMQAYDTVAAEHGVSRQAVIGWCQKCRGWDPSDHAALLVSRHVGGQLRDDIAPEVLELWYTFYGRVEQPTATAAYEDLTRAVAGTPHLAGTPLPSLDRLLDRWHRLPVVQRVYLREGRDAAAELFPAVRRDHAVFHALEAIEADQHVWDVRVEFPHGVVMRPTSIAIQDAYSGRLLGIRWAEAADAWLVRLVFADVVEQYGLPRHLYVDNGREFSAKALTGGAKHRFRFRVRPETEEPLGILTQLGIEYHATLPYSGRSKAIERTHKEFATRIAKDPCFAGAYTGPHPAAKPANYGAAAVPFDEFVRVATEQIALLNQRPCASAVCRGRSRHEAFAESYAQAAVRRVTAAQRALWLLASQPLTVSKTGTLTVFGNTYFHETLLPHRGQKVVARFDPEHLDRPLEVTTLRGEWIATAPVWGAVKYNDAATFKGVARDHKEILRAEVARAKALTRIDLREAAARRVAPVDPPLPAPAHVAPLFGAPTLGVAGSGSVAAPTPGTTPVLEDWDVDDVTKAILKLPRRTA